MALPLASGQTGGFYCCFVHSRGHQFSRGACALLEKGGIRVAPLQAEESVQRKAGHQAPEILPKSLQGVVGTSWASHVHFELMLPVF